MKYFFKNFIFWLITLYKEAAVNLRRTSEDTIIYIKIVLNNHKGKLYCSKKHLYFVVIQRTL